MPFWKVVECTPVDHADIELQAYRWSPFKSPIYFKPDVHGKIEALRSSGSPPERDWYEKNTERPRPLRKKIFQFSKSLTIDRFC